MALARAATRIDGASTDAALEPLPGEERRPVPRAGRIRRCTVRHVSILAAPSGPVVQADCLLGGRQYPLPLGTMDEARMICNACTARGVWREDED